MNKPNIKTSAPKAEETPKTQAVAEKISELPPGHIRVETTGAFSLIDPATGLDISHEGPTTTPRTSFVTRMLELKRLKEV